ncbi:MAG TPA: threonine--tRNA ligase [Deltaproteobacteria bacterium]|nr:threonine--tRNA ligase [Deltaproteobacteria bacterium]
MIKATLPEGGEKTFDDGATCADVLRGLDEKLARRAVAVRVDGVVRDLREPLGAGDVGGRAVVVEPVTLDSPEGLDICRHSAAHVVAQAVKEVMGGDVKLAIGPTIADGFYYDFDAPRPFTPQDIEAVEEAAREIVRSNIPFEREELGRHEAISLFRELGEDYKVELIEEMERPTVSVFRQDGFVDLCRGPHLPSTGWIKAFKLTGTAGAYWRGDEKNRMLQRVYGTAFADRKALKAHLARIEEAKRRDHRKLGRELDLFSTSDDIGAGLVLWHPKGATIRRIIEDFWRTEHVKGGYHIVYSPHVAKLDLWKRSGHWDFYRDNLFSPMDVEGQEYIVKPMNCPFHIELYRSRLRSYRDLPIRYAELGTVYRFERSGVLHGLLRVRGFTQDDAHIFTTPQMLEDEIRGVLNFTLYILKSFGFNEFQVYLSTRPDKFVGTPENWDAAEKALAAALDAADLDYEIDPGEGVFYGPKIDIKIRDVLGRAWQCSTVQVDFNLPERFDVTYRGADGGESRPIMIHRALMGSLERFFGCLVEHYAGAFPLWLAPVQAKVLTVTDRTAAYAASVLSRLRDEGFRAELDDRNEKLGFKIREAQLEKIPYMLVIGDREAQRRLVAPRIRGEGDVGAMSVDALVERMKRENRPLGGELS